METHADGSEIYIGLDNQFSGFKKLLNKNYDFIHAAMGTYQVTEAGPARLELNGQYVTADKLRTQVNGVLQTPNGIVTGD